MERQLAPQHSEWERGISGMATGTRKSDVECLSDVFVILLVDAIEPDLTATNRSKKYFMRKLSNS